VLTRLAGGYTLQQNHRRFLFSASFSTKVSKSRNSASGSALMATKISASERSGPCLRSWKQLHLRPYGCLGKWWRGLLDPTSPSVKTNLTLIRCELLQW
jgi:hypothetical protein